MVAKAKAKRPARKAAKPRVDVSEAAIARICDAMMLAIQSNATILRGHSGAAGAPGVTHRELRDLLCEYANGIDYRALESAVSHAVQKASSGNAIMLKLQEFDHLVVAAQERPKLLQIERNLAVQTSHVHRLLAEKEALLRDLKLARFDLQQLRAARPVSAREFLQAVKRGMGDSKVAAPEWLEILLMDMERERADG